MKPFKKYIFKQNCIVLESTGKQMELHLTHLEDLAIERGKQGFMDFVALVDLLVKKLQGQESDVDVNAKIDGSPALIFGRDPRKEFKNQFFIALKYSVDPAKGIIKEDAKLLHSQQDIQLYYGDRPAFAQKLNNIFQELNRAYDNSGLIYQCDVLYASNEDKREQVVDGEEFLVFKPNVIVYAIPLDHLSALYAQTKKSSVGIVVHDSFTATQKDNTIVLHHKSRKVPSIVDSGKRANVLILSANFEQAQVHVDQALTTDLHNNLIACHELIQQIDDNFDVNYVNSQLMEYLKIFINKQVDLPQGGIFGKKTNVTHINNFIQDFKKFLEKRFDVIIGNKKTEKGRMNQLSKLQNLLNYLQDHADSVVALLSLFSKMIHMKKQIMSLVENLSHALRKTFFESPDGSLVATKGEGHVIFHGNTHVKIVDRLEFTKVNRSRGGQRA